MSQTAANSLAEALWREEKSFLIQHYAHLLLEELEASGDLDDKIVASLQVARPYADAALAMRIANLLDLHGLDAPLNPTNGALLADEATPSSADLNENGEELDSLYDEEEEESGAAADLFADEDALAEDDDDAENLFAGEEDDSDFLHDEDDDEDDDELFAGDEEDWDEHTGLVGEEEEALAAAVVEEDLFAEDAEEEAAAVASEADEEAGVLFAEDIYSGNTGTEKAEIEETPRFNPTQSSEEGATAGFDAPEVSEKESKTGRRKNVAEKQMKKGTNSKEATKSKKEKGLNTEATPQEENKSSHAEQSATGKKEAMERMAKAKEELERRKQNRRATEKEEEASEEVAVEEESSAAGLLGNIAYQVSLDDIEQRLGIQTIPEDRTRLDRLLAQKMRDPSIRALLEGATEEGVTLALLPRLPRFIREGQLFQVNGATLVRSYPQFFENVQQIVLKLHTEAFFLQQSPGLDWAIVTTEILNDSRQKTYMQQKQALKTHAQRYQATESRVRRRNMIDVLYDLLVIKLVHGVNMLSETVDLTESKVGRQNLAFINYGENGIRISDIGRRQTHPQLGVCPNW